MKSPPCFDDLESKKLIQDLCEEHRVDIALLKDLCELMQQHSGSGRKEGIDAEIAGCVDRFLSRKPNL
jgi:hypothetical protein